MLSRLPWQTGNRVCGVERGPLQDPVDREIEPRLGEVLVELVAHLHAAFERIGLERAPVLERARAVLER